MAGFNAGRALLDFVSGLGRQIARQPRQRLLAGGGAALLVAIAGVLLASSLHPQPKLPTQELAVQPTVAATDTATSLPTNTAVKPTPTHTKPKPPAPPPPPPPPPTPTTVPGATPTPCGPNATVGPNATQADIRTALQNAATTYSIPVNLLYAVAWQESQWHQNVTSCDGGIGLMQIQYYSVSTINNNDGAGTLGACGLGVTSYDAHVLQDNANLGAKFLKYTECFWAYWGNSTQGKSVSSPAPYTSAWYYANYPQVQTTTGAGTPTPTLAPRPYPDTGLSDSFCATPFSANAYYPDLPATGADAWSCPYSATVGDNTLLDITVSSYNEGISNVVRLGINNRWYVTGVEGYVKQFHDGTLPV